MLTTQCTPASIYLFKPFLYFDNPCAMREIMVCTTVEKVASPCLKKPMYVNHLVTCTRPASMYLFEPFLLYFDDPCTSMYIASLTCLLQCK